VCMRVYGDDEVYRVCCSYGVAIDGERGNRPNIVSREELLQQSVSACDVMLYIIFLA